jgi:uncharacterized protein (TIGR03492 family)
MKKILFITNGHGEDIVAAQIIKYLKGKRLKIDVLPVVGKGNIFKGKRVNVIGPKKALPSGGFALRNYSYLIKDLFAGLLSKVIDQMKAIRANKKGYYALVVGIGDIVPLIYSMITGSKFIFVGVNKSEFYQKLAFNYTGLEKWLLKKYCTLTFARDRKTARSLRSLGIKTMFVGNPMMDAVKDIRASEYQKIRKGRKKVIGFLPGTREDAYKNIEDFYKIAWQIDQLDKSIKFIMSFPRTLNKHRLAKINKPIDMPMISDFNNVLKSSDLIIGMSGTGNEQAAGVGLPVIAFPGRGAQFNNRFASGQKQLLGDALLLLPRNSRVIAHEAVSLIYNRKRMAKMGNAGRKRMGGPGATKRIAEMISRMAGR